MQISKPKKTKTTYSQILQAYTGMQVSKRILLCSLVPTRSSITDLKVPSVKTTQAKSKISFSGASLFNSLPSELKDIENHSIYSYKKKLKTYFIQLNYEVDHVNKFRCIDCKHITHCQCYSQ